MLTPPSGKGKLQGQETSVAKGWEGRESAAKGTGNSGGDDRSVCLHCGGYMPVCMLQTP